MAYHNRYESLMTKHRDLEIALATEMKRPLPDTLVVQELKRTKLVVKDEMVEWSIVGRRSAGSGISERSVMHA